MNLPLNSTNLPLTHHMKFNKSALKFIESALNLNESALKFKESALLKNLPLNLPNMHSSTA